MSTLARRLVLVFALVVATGLVAAYFVVTHIARPTYLTLCERPAAALRVTGFGDATPDVTVCVGGRELPVRATLDDRSGVLRIDGDASLAQLDGVRRGPGQVRVSGTTIDHGQDAVWARLLELATPFADFEPTEPVAPEGDHPWEEIELGMPRVTATGSGARLELELGEHARNPTLSVVAIAAR